MKLNLNHITEKYKFLLARDDGSTTSQYSNVEDKVLIEHVHER